MTTLLSNLVFAFCVGMGIYLRERNSFGTKSIFMLFLPSFLGFSVVFDIISLVKPDELRDLALTKYLASAGVLLALYAAKIYFRSHHNSDANPSLSSD